MHRHPTMPGPLAGLHLALCFLTRLPLPPLGAVAPGGLARAMPWFPLVGGLVGAAGGAVMYVAQPTLGGMLAALLAVLTTVLLTGGLHEDGLADVADGFGGGRDRARKLDIMRDSRVGSFGVLALLFSLSLRAGGLAALAPGAAPWALVAAAALSRALQPMAMALSRPARSDGLGASAGRPDALTVTLAGVAALALAVLMLGPVPALVAASAAVLAGVIMVLLAERQIGGYTGDVLGAVQQVGEAAALLALVAWR